MPIPASFLFHNAMTNTYSINLTINDKSVEGVLGTRNRGSRMEAADESTDLWRHVCVRGIPFDINLSSRSEQFCVG